MFKFIDYYKLAVTIWLVEGKDWEYAKDYADNIVYGWRKKCSTSNTGQKNLKK